LHDAILFEAQGVPTAVVTTTEFVDAAKRQARNLGMPQFEAVAVAHPIQPLDAPEVRVRADLAFPMIIRQLLRGGGLTESAPASGEAEAGDSP
jgi:hypothetical protein